MAEKTATLVFDEYPADEVVVRLAPIPMEDYFDVLERFDAVKEGAGFDGIRGLFDRFADVALVSWTFPEAADAAGLRRRDLNLALAIIGQWISGVRDVPLPLPLSSSAGAPSRAKSNRQRR